MQSGTGPKLFIWQSPEAIVTHIQVLKTSQLADIPRNGAQFVIWKIQTLQRTRPHQFHITEKVREVVVGKIQGFLSSQNGKHHPLAWQARNESLVLFTDLIELTGQTISVVIKKFNVNQNHPARLVKSLQKWARRDGFKTKALGKSLILFQNDWSGHGSGGQF